MKTILEFWTKLKYRQSLLGITVIYAWTFPSFSRVLILPVIIVNKFEIEWIHHYSKS